MVRPRVFLDIVVGTQPAGRIVIELFNDKTPETCENFRLLCNGSKGQVRTPSGTHDLCYKNSTFHRIISEFMIQGGDGTNGDGTGGASTFPGGKMFADENLGWRNIDTEGLVCMANRGKSTNSSQFFITLADCDYLTPKHTLFGHVVTGMDVVKKLESLPVDTSDRPTDPVIIANCGELLFRKKEPPKNTFMEAHRERPRSRDRKDDDTRRRRKRSRSRNPKRSRSRSKDKDSAPPEKGGGATEKDTEVVEDGRGRSRDRKDSKEPVVSPPPPPPPPQKRSRSRSRHRHRRRRHHSGSRSPERRRHRRGKSRSRSRRGYRVKAHDYIRDEGAEERIRREEEERESERFARMEEEAVKGGKGAEPEVKFKGRGSMKYREKKNWGWGGGEGRLV